MDRRDLIRLAFRSWFDSDVEPPFTRPWRLHAFDRSVEMASDWRETVLAPWTTGFPDIGWSIRRVVADGDWGAAHLDVVGTHLGRWRELEATGRSLAWEHMFFVRFDGELVAEMWEVFDPAHITEQLTAAAESSG